MDREVALLANLPPSNWSEALRRMEVLDAYRQIEAPTVRDIERHAELLKLNPRSFYRLIRAYDDLGRAGSARQSKRGTTRSLPADASAIIEQVRGELGREVPDRMIHLEVAKRCVAAGLPVPSSNAVRTRDMPSQVDLRIRLRRRFSFVIDACPLDFDVFDEGPPTRCVRPAWLTCLLDGADGGMLAHLVTAGEPAPQDMVEMLEAVRSSAPSGSTLLATGELHAKLAAVVTTDDLPLVLDVPMSRGLRPGAAMVPALGLKIGRMSLHSRRRKAMSEGTAVSLGMARRVVEHALAHGDT
jgi:hypothetical protein